MNMSKQWSSGFRAITINGSQLSSDEFIQISIIRI